MFIKDYLLPAITLVRSNQKVILHNLALLLSTMVLTVVGLLVVLTPTVVGFTLDGIAIAELETIELQTIVMTKHGVQAGLAVSLLLLLLKEVFLSSFYLGGLISALIGPKESIIDAIKEGFKASRRGFLPVLLVVLGAFGILALFGGAAGAGWFMLKEPMVAYAALGLGALILSGFCLFSSLTLWVAIMEGEGPIDSLKHSFAAVGHDFGNYLGLIITLMITNAVVSIVPLLGVFVGLIIVPVSVASMAGFLHVNKRTKHKQAEKPVVHNPPPAAEGHVEQKQAPAVKEKVLDDEEKTKAALDKILKQI